MQNKTFALILGGIVLVLLVDAFYPRDPNKAHWEPYCVESGPKGCVTSVLLCVGKGDCYANPQTLGN